MRQIPVNAGNTFEQIALPDAGTLPPWTPTGKAETIAMSGRVTLPDPDEARGWAMTGLIGGFLVMAAVDLMLMIAALATGSYAVTLALGSLALLIPPAFYVAPFVVRFTDRRRVDHRVREAMPTPRPRVAVQADTVIQAARVNDAMSERVKHLHKLMTLATWAASEERDEAGNVVKAYGAAPALRRDGKGYGRFCRALTVKATGDTIRLEEQQQLNAELEAVGILRKGSDGWGLADPTWTLDDVIDRMEAALGHE